MIVIEQVDQVEVYLNEGGMLVVKQESMGEDSYVVFHPSHANAICKAIRAAAREAKAD